MTRDKVLMDEADIVRRVRSGEVNAFSLLVDAHGQQVLSIVGRHAPADKAVELAHETFVRAFEKLGTYRGDKPFAHWLAKIALTRCAEYWRGRYRSRETSFSALDQGCRQWIEGIAADAAQDSSGALHGVEALAQQAEAGVLLEWAMNQLNPDDRMVVTMTHLEGQAVNDVASQLGWTVSKVKVRAHRARRKLRDVLGNVLD